jgi:hypothetical protein
MTIEKQLGAGAARERFLPRLRRALQSHPPRKDAEKAMDYRALQAVIGWIAFLLVPVVYFGNWVFFTPHVLGCLWPSARLPDSLSAYYYTHMRGLFVGAMCALGLFLAAYRGYDRWDNRLTNVAGLAAVCIGLSPTLPASYKLSPSGPNLFFTRKDVCGPSTLITYQQSPNQAVFGRVHQVSLVVLFVMVFLMVLVQFTRTTGADGKDRGDPAGAIRASWNSAFSHGIRGWLRSLCAWWTSLFPDDPRKAKKKRRNRIYVCCAAGVAICGLLALLTAIRPSIDSVAPWLLFAECGAFAFFGIAWHVKGVASAASAPADHPQVFVWLLSRMACRWLADDPDAASVGGQEPATADLA